MRTRKRDGQTMRSVLANMVTDARVLETVADHWPKSSDLFDAPAANQVGGWCVDYFRQYGKAPGRAIRVMFHDWATSTQAPEETIKGVETFLAAADEELEHADPEHRNPDFVLEQAGRYFNDVRLRRTIEQAEEFGGTNRLKEAQGVLAEYEPFSLNGKADKWPLYTMEDIFQGDYELEPWNIWNCLVAGQGCIIAGPEKSMKTSIALDLAVSLASGENFLGADCFPVLQPANVMLMSGESGIATLRKNLRTVFRERCGTRQYAKQDRDRGIATLQKRIMLSDKVPRFDCKPDLAVVGELIEQNDIEVLIVDTAGMAMPGDTASNMNSQYRLLGDMNEVCRERGAMLSVVHHTHRRKDNHAPVNLDDIAFAGYKEWARQWILIGRSSPYDPPEPGESRLHNLWLTIGGSAGHSSLHGLTIDEGTRQQPQWKITLSGATQTRVEAQAKSVNRNLDVDKALLLSKLRGHPEGMTERALRDAMKRDAYRCKAAAESLSTDDLIVTCEIVAGNRQRYPGWRLK